MIGVVISVQNVYTARTVVVMRRRAQISARGLLLSQFCCEPTLVCVESRSPNGPNAALTRHSVLIAVLLRRQVRESPTGTPTEGRISFRNRGARAPCQAMQQTRPSSRYIRTLRADLP